MVECMWRSTHFYEKAVGCTPVPVQLPGYADRVAVVGMSEREWGRGVFDSAVWGVIGAG